MKPLKKSLKVTAAWLEKWHANPDGKNPYFVKRRICAMCGIWPVSQSYLCHGCKDILLMKIALQLGVEIE